MILNFGILRRPGSYFEANPLRMEILPVSRRENRVSQAAENWGLPISVPLVLREGV